MSRKGGYKIIDLKGLDFSSNKVIDGIYESIEDNYGKPLLFSGIVIGGIEKDDVFANVVVNGDGYDVTLYGQTLHISNIDVVSYKRDVTKLDTFVETTLMTLPNGVYRVDVLTNTEYEANKPIILIGELEEVDSVSNSSSSSSIAFNTNTQDVVCIVLNECVLFGQIRDEF